MPISLKKLLRPRSVIVIVLTLGIIGYFFFGRNPKKEEPKFAKAERQGVESLVSASGVLNGEASSVVKFASGGRLAYLGVKIGDNVVRGQVLATLDRQSLSSSLQQARNTLRQREAEVQKILDDVKGHESDETFAQKATRTASEVAKDNAYEAVIQAEKAMRDATVIAPISGVIVDQSDITTGQNVTGSDIVAHIVDFKEFTFLGDVDESDISKVEVGQEATVTLNAYEGKAFKGKVVEVYPLAESSSSGATTVKVKILIESEGITQISGLEGSADIVVKKASSAITVPSESIFEEKYVYVKDGGKFTKREVVLGISSDTRTEIVSGVSEGEELVVNPYVVR